MLQPQSMSDSIRRGPLGGGVSRLGSGGRVFLLVTLSISLSHAGCSKSETSDNTVKPSAGPGKEGRAGVEVKERLPEAAQLLAAHVQAAGGEKAIEAISSIYTEATLDVKAQSLKGKVKSWWKGGRFYIEESVEGVGRTRAGYDGMNYWSDDPVSQLRRLTGAEAEQYAWASSMFLPAHWKKHFQSAKTTAARKINGSTYYDVELRTAGGERLVMSFDKQSKLMREQKFEQISAMGKIPITVRLSDYRAVQGYKFPHRQELETPILSGVQVYDAFKVNEEIDETLFTMPTQHEVVPADPKEQKIAKPPRK